MRLGHLGLGHLILSYLILGHLILGSLVSRHSGAGHLLSGHLALGHLVLGHLAGAVLGVRHLISAHEELFAVRQLRHGGQISLGRCGGGAVLGRCGRRNGGGRLYGSGGNGRLLRLWPVKRRVEGVEVPEIQLILGDAQGLAETLEVHDFPFSQIADRITYIRVFDDAEDVVVGGAGFLFWRDLVKTTYKNTRKNR